jgi:RNA polymerase-binding transcription factor
VDTEQYRQRLLALERELAARAEREAALGREQVLDTAADIGDASVADEAASADFSEAERDSDVLKQVRDALARIDQGTFGRCVVDGEPIDPRRLDAMPWTPYCLRHQTLRESGAPPTPTM